MQQVHLTGRASSKQKAKKKGGEARQKFRNPMQGLYQKLVFLRQCPKLKIKSQEEQGALNLANQVLLNGQVGRIGSKQINAIDRIYKRNANKFKPSQ